jgi:NAD(P)-dependent dehydrogenase (short-subunit alcohol dehydrogenase family)
MPGKTIIVTGASGNMGQEVVKKFLAEQYRVIATIVDNDPVPFEITHDQLEKAVVNLMNEDDAEKFVQSVIVKQGSIDAAVLTVGGFAMGKIADTKTSDIYKQYRLNFETAYNVARPVFIQMMKQGAGRIFLVGARPGLDMSNAGGMVAYGLGKSLIFRLAELMNDEAKGSNVVTSVIVPSTIDTPQNRQAMPGADFDNWVTASAIAELIYFHSTEAAAPLRESIIKIYNKA